MDKYMKKIVVTGPTGAIGVALIQLLIEKNIEVLAVVRKGSKRKANIPQSDMVQIVELNLDEIKDLPQLVKEKYDVFYHFGWDGTFGNSRNNMQEQLKNIQYALDAVETAYEMGCKKFIGAGSQAEYGRVEGKLSADTPAFPENGYGVAKLCAGQMTRILCEQKGIEHIWTRILSVYGPYDGENTMVMSTIKKLLAGEKPSFTKCGQMWDYLYSKDAGKAMYLIGTKGVSGKTYCLGSGQVKPLLSYVEDIRDVIDPSAKLGIGEVPYASNQVMYLCADIEELKRDVGFLPEYEFNEGVKETFNWYQSKKEIFSANRDLRFYNYRY